MSTWAGVALREELLEEHWSYMDGYAVGMIARGPTLAGDGDTPTGSVHIVELPDPAAARAFAFDERPNPMTIRSSPCSVGSLSAVSM